MDDPIFDAVFALCFAAEDAGYDAVAQALELVLDVYLLERREIYGLDWKFVSCRSEQAQQVAAFQEALDEASPVVGWSASFFPLQHVG